LVVGCLFLQKIRQSGSFGHAAWLWVACTCYLAVLLATYVIGSPEIHWWLLTTLGRSGQPSRTTIFPQMALYTDLAIWLVLALEPDRQHALAPSPYPAATMVAVTAEAP
jgi:hypothetical protein